MIDAFIQVLSPWLLLVALGGVSLGIIWGALPGLSTTMAMALLISLSTGREQSSALVFMLGVYTGSVFGGAISAVFVNIPGTPDAVPTMIEGHALANRGERGQALGMAIAGSFVGNWVGILLLVSFIPLVLIFAQQFRSWEMALLGMIGISICGSMACGAMPLKGWIAGWLGILVALVGFDPIHGVQRYTPGLPELMDGANYVSVLISPFGLTEIIRVIPSLRKLARHSVAAARSGVIGAVTGAIPGASAKAAVSMMTQYLAKDMAPHGIAANTVAPGTTTTDRVNALLTPEREAAFVRMTPAGRLAEPEDIVGTIAFLASDDAACVTGTTIDVNGGWLMLV